MVLDPKLIKASPVTFTHQIVEGFRDPEWHKVWPVKRAYAGDRIPTGYGIAWKMWEMDAYVIMPIPLNILTSWLRALWYGGIHGYTLDALAKAEMAGYELGKAETRRAMENQKKAAVAEAYQRGREDCTNDLLAELNRRAHDRRQN